MIKELDIRLSPAEAHDDSQIKAAVARKLAVRPTEISATHVLKRSIDARGKVVYQLRIKAWINEEAELPTLPEFADRDVSNGEPVLVIGAGPAGLFAALELISQGLKPIVIERGKEVRARRRDLAAINREQIVNPESNYCFGEGGAGTYSDGKLYTRSGKRGSIREVLQWLVAFGASPDILVNAHPHIGTNKLPKIIEAMRDKIRACGGEVLFETRMDDLVVENHQVQGIVTQKGEEIRAKDLILATGHSARDVFRLLHRKGILIELKPFALGVRIEHPQELIDQIQYRCDSRGEYLPPASYSLVNQVKERGVYSFCMCPGGIIAPCATEQEEVVTNGWSPSRRNNPFANSGIVVELRPEDFKKYKDEGPLAALAFQASIERQAWIEGGKTQVVPAQRMQDFTRRKLSTNLPETSYKPGIVSREMESVFPSFITDSLRGGLINFGKKMKGYMSNEAVLHAPESRTSSPVRIPRDMETLEHPDVKGLYPCGEGAGYAGGIVSAAIDGRKCALMIAEKLKK